MTQIVVDVPNIVATAYQMGPTTAPNTVLEIGKSYWWRIVAYDNAGNTTIPNPNKITVVAPTTPYYPINNETNISCAFGPRNAQGNWFHNGTDIGNGPQPAANVIAPCNCQVTYVRNNNNADGLDHVDFNVTEAPLTLKSFRFQHVVIDNNKVWVGKTFKRGEVVCTNLELYGSGYHVHTCGWNAAQNQGIRANELLCFNSLSFWPNTARAFAYRNVGPKRDLISGVSDPWPRDPQHNNLRYFYFTIAQPGSDYTLNKVVVSVSALSSGNDITSNFLEDPAAATIDLNLGSSVDRTSDGGVQENINNESGHSVIFSGAKLFAPDMPTGGEKKLTFWYYIREDAPNPAYVAVSVYDCKTLQGNLKLNFTNTLPQTPIGGPPDPVTSVSVAALTTNNGLKITWVPKTGINVSYADYWIVFRKTANSSESPLQIGIATSTSFEDRTDIQTNTIVPGTTYSYTVAGVNELGFGAYGPWKNGTMTAIPNDFVFQNRTVWSSEADLKTSNSITVKTVDVWPAGAKKFKAGNTLNIVSPIETENGSKIDFRIEPALR
jgi:hypothetical protein